MTIKIEDIKLNKNKKQITFREEIILRGEPSKSEKFYRKENEILNKIPQKEIVSDHEEPEEKIITDKESKIDEYLKNRSNKNIDNKRLQQTPRLKERKRPVRKNILLIFVFAVLVGLVYLIGNYFEKTDITITSKRQQINYDNEQFVASKNLQDSNVKFEIMIVPDKRSKSIILTEPKEVSINAHGEVVLLNEYSTNNQNLVAGTMLSDSEGKTYKLEKETTIPGYTTKDGKIIAGQVNVPVVAFLPGDVYNGSPDDFHINAFKNTAKYDKIYGKLKEPFSGGASGLVYTLDDNDKETVRKIAESSFKEELYDKVKALVPEGYILYEGATNFSYKVPDNFYSKEAETSIDIEGTLAVVLLKKDSLEQNIIKTSLPKIKEDERKEIKIPKLENFTFSFVNDGQQITKETESIPFYLSGQAEAVWSPNVELLKSKLLGVNKNSTIEIFRQDPGISSAIVEIFPPWRKNVSEKINKINIILE